MSRTRTPTLTEISPVHPLVDPYVNHILSLLDARSISSLVAQSLLESHLFARYPSASIDDATFMAQSILDDASALFTDAA